MLIFFFQHNYIVTSDVYDINDISYTTLAHIGPILITVLCEHWGAVVLCNIGCQWIYM